MSKPLTRWWEPAQNHRLWNWPISEQPSLNFNYYLPPRIAGQTRCIKMRTKQRRLGKTIATDICTQLAENTRISTEPWRERLCTAIGTVRWASTKWTYPYLGNEEPVATGTATSLAKGLAAIGWWESRYLLHGRPPARSSDERGLFPHSRKGRRSRTDWP